MIKAWLERRRTRRHAEMLARKIPSVLASFGELIAKHPGAYMDESWLPLSKADMKLLFKIAIAAERDPRRRDWLMGGWSLLSQFQPKIGNVPLPGELPEKPTPEALAALGRFVEIGRIAQAEAERDLQELRAFLATKSN